MPYSPVIASTIAIAANSPSSQARNFGWPTATYGIDYNGQRMENNDPHRAGVEQPVYFWSPVIAPGGMQFYTGNAFPAWRGNLFIGSLKEKRLVRLELEDRRVAGEEHLLLDRNQRVRDVRQGPDGALYLVTDQQNGELSRMALARCGFLEHLP